MDVDQGTQRTHSPWWVVGVTSARVEEVRVVSSTNLGPTPQSHTTDIKTEICPVPRGNRLSTKPMGVEVGG